MIQLNKEQITGVVNYFEKWVLMQWVSLQSEDGTVRTEVVETGILEIIEEELFKEII